MEQYLSLFDGKVFIESCGEGEPVVLIHDAAAYHFCWRKVAPVLARHFHVVVPDLLGFGLSDKPKEATYSKEKHAERLNYMLHQLGIPPFHLVGHSMGAEVAVHVALKNPKMVKSLTLIAPDGFRQGVNELTRKFAKHGWLDGLFKVMSHKPPKQKKICKLSGIPLEKITQEIVEGWAKPYRDPGLPYVMARALADDDTGVVSDKVKELSMPVLLIYGTNDSQIPMSVFESYAEALPHPMIEKYEGVGHAFMEECPEKIARSIEHFIRR